MAASIECCIHVFFDEQSHFASFKENVANNQGLSREMETVRWCEERIGVKTQLSDVQPGPLCTAGFHTPCYRRFTDKTKIASSVIRCAKVGQQTSLSLTILWKLVMTSGGSYYLLLKTLSICLQREGKQCLSMLPLA